MAARSKKIRHDEETRSKIQAAQIINRLYKNVMGEVELTSTQVSSANILLRKVLPDLQATTIEGTGDAGEIIFRTVYESKPG